MAADLPNPLILPLNSRVSMEFRLIPPGRFRMGSRYGEPHEQPVHWVEITRPFYLGIYPVTQEQFAVWTESEGIDHKNYFPDNPLHPAEKMNWFEARSYCEWLTCQQQSTIPEGYLAVLPSESEWEYSCRAGTETEYHTGDGEAALLSAGWFDENSGYRSHDVGEKLPNGFGLYDMHGNVWEWCRDVLDESAYRKRVEGVRDPVVKAVDIGEREEDAFRANRRNAILKF